MPLPLPERGRRSHTDEIWLCCSYPPRCCIGLFPRLLGCGHSSLPAFLAVPLSRLDGGDSTCLSCVVHGPQEVPSASVEDEIATGPAYVAEVHSPGLPGGRLPSNILLVPDDLKAMKFFVDLV